MNFREKVLAALMAIAILVIIGAPLVYTQVTLRSIEASLPVKVIEHERLVEQLTSNTMKLERTLQWSIINSTAASHIEIRKNIHDLRQLLNRAQGIYGFDNLFGISSIHAVIAPALADLENWLSNGLYGLEPNSIEILTLAQRRASDAHNESMKLANNAHQHALDLVNEQSNRILAFRNLATLVLLMTILLAMLMVYFFFRQRLSTQRLRENESVLSSFMEHSPTEMSLKSSNGDYLWASRYTRELFNIDQDNQAGNYFSDNVSQDLVQELLAHERLVHRTGKPAEREYMVKTGNDIKTIRVLKFPVLDTDQNIMGTGSIGIDITANKNSESRFRDMAEVASDWFWEMDADLRFTYQSEKFERITGIPSSETIGKTREEAFKDRIDQPEKWHRRGIKLKKHEPYSMVFDLVRPDGQTRSLHTQAMPFYLDNGEFAGYRGIGTDITEQRRAEKELVNSEQRFRDFADIASDFLWEMDADLRFSYISERYLKVAGMVSENILGTTREELWSRHMVRPGQWQDHLEALKTHKPIEPLTVEWKRPDGTIRHIFFDGKCLFDTEGGFAGYRGIARDVTDITVARQVTEKALDTAQSASLAKTDFLANISHEIRTPMTLIIGMSEMLNDTQMSDQQQKYLGTIRNAGNSLLALINRILDMSKIETGNLVLSSEEFDLQRVVSSLVEAYAIQARDKGLSLVQEISEDTKIIQVGDSYRLEQVLRNLLDNAIKFTREGGIKIRVENDPEAGSARSIRFTVSDSGVGVSDDQQDAIFDAFVQQDASTTREYGGTGLGLAISRQIVTAMGGKIWAESVPGVGSKFIFTVKFGGSVRQAGFPNTNTRRLSGNPPRTHWIFCLWKMKS